MEGFDCGHDQTTREIQKCEFSDRLDTGNGTRSEKMHWEARCEDITNRGPKIVLVHGDCLMCEAIRERENERRSMAHSYDDRYSDYDDDYGRRSFESDSDDGYDSRRDRYYGRAGDVFAAPRGGVEYYNEVSTYTREREYVYAPDYPRMYVPTENYDDDLDDGWDHRISGHSSRR